MMKQIFIDLQTRTCHFILSSFTPNPSQPQSLYADYHVAGLFAEKTFFPTPFGTR